MVYRGGIAGVGKARGRRDGKAAGGRRFHTRPPERRSTGPARRCPFEDPHGSLIYSSELIFENIPGAPVHHASSITEAANGDLLVTWYGGSYESSDDEALFLARRKKGQRNWEPPRMLLRNPAAPVGNAVIFTGPAAARLDRVGPHGGQAAAARAHGMGADAALLSRFGG